MKKTFLILNFLFLLIGIHHVQNLNAENIQGYKLQFSDNNKYEDTDIYSIKETDKIVNTEAETDVKVVEPKWKYLSNNEIYCAPAIDDAGTVYIGTRFGEFIAFNPDGTVKWKYKISANIWSSPSIATDGTIYFGAQDNWIYALNPDGSLKWKYETWGFIYSSVSIGFDGTVYVGSEDRYLYALNPNGKLKWKYYAGGKISWSSPTIGADGTIYFGASDNYLYALNPDGTFKWKYNAAKKIWCPAVIDEDGNLYIGCEGKLEALTSDGTYKWKIETWGNAQTPVIDNNGTLYFGDSKNFFYAINILNGSKKWTLQEGNSTDCAAIGKDGTIFYGTSNIYGNGYLFAVNPSGSILWRYGISTGFITAPTIAPDGTLYIGAQDGLQNCLFAFNTNTGGIADSPWPCFMKNNKHTNNLNSGNYVPPPVAQFEFSEPWYYVPDEIIFTDLSVGNITSWLWDFGDGTTSTEQNPSHLYLSPGTYTISLTVTGSGGSNTITKKDIIYYRVEPKLKYSASPRTGVAPLEVKFLNESTGDIDSVLWDFGDGTYSSEQNPTHIYQHSGNFDVELTIHYLGASVGSKDPGFVKVRASVPVADFTATPTIGNKPLEVSFTDNSSGEITSWLWDFGDGTTSSVQNPSHIYTLSGFYTVSLTVKGPGGQDEEVKVNLINATTPAPIADFTATPVSGNKPLEVSFTDNSSGEITSWLWDFGDGTTSSEQNPSHMYTLSGSFTVSLTVNGPGGQDEEVKVNLISATTPAPIADFTATPAIGNKPLEVSFTDNSSGEITSWLWDFGDGTTSSEQNPSHMYTLSGFFTVSLTVKGPGGQDEEVKVNLISATTPAPIADFIATPVSGNKPLEVSFTDKSSGEITSWLWDFGDRTTSTEQNPIHTFTIEGTYSVSLFVSGEGGNDSIVKNSCINVTKTNKVNGLKTNEDFLVFPNPSKGLFFINEMTDNQISKVEVYSVTGERVLCNKANEPIRFIDLSNSADGVYFLIINEDKSKVIKITKN